jgi:hypothetical protein
MLAKESWKFPVALVVAALLAACHAPGPSGVQAGHGGAAPGAPVPGVAAGSPAESTPPPPSPRPLPPPLPPRDVPTYRIDPAQSSLRVLVYRAGTLASLGHDHVIDNHALTGWVGLAPGAEQTSFYLEIPVAAFVIDDAAARADAGPEFAAEVGSDAKEGTRRNMLGPALLDAEHHASLAVRSLAFQGSEPNLVATVVAEVAGHATTLTIPVHVARGERRVTARADFPVRQTELGLTPFSVMRGALRVADEIKLRLVLVAVPE